MKRTKGKASEYTAFFVLNEHGGTRKFKRCATRPNELVDKRSSVNGMKF